MLLVSFHIRFPSLGSSPIGSLSAIFGFSLVLVPDGLPECSTPALRASWLPGFCLVYRVFFPHLFFCGQTGFASSLRLLGRSLHQRLFLFFPHVGSLAIAVFPTSLFTTIPCSDFLPPVVLFLSVTDLSRGYRLAGTIRSPWVTSSHFPPNPVLLTYRATDGIGLSFPLQGCPALPANLV